MSAKQGKQLPKALGYLRKSTRGNKTDGSQKQEKSLGQQKSEITKLVKGRFEIAAWYEDDGVSGWKRGANRPDFQKMLEEAKGHGAEAIVVDNIDRFSRASVGDVQADANSLRQADVRWIVTASHGDYDLGAKFDIGEILKFVIAIWSSCEYSRQLGRRVSLARRNAAMEGKRTGGRAPYGLADDGKGGLKHGDKRHIKVVRWIFVQFVVHLRSMCWIASELNRKGEPGPKGGKWYVVTVRALLKRKAYRGDFSFNESPQGQFFRLDAEGEVVEHSKANGNGKVFQTKGLYSPLVDPKLFDKAEKRLATIGHDRSRRKRVGYALSGLLICSHCGSPLYGCKPKNKIIYRCGSPARKGASSCRNYQVREDLILPFIMKMLSEEIESVMQLLSEPPTDILYPQDTHKEREAELRSERKKLEAQVETATRNLMLSEDSRSRKSMDKALSKMRDELDELDRQIADGTGSPVEYSTDELAALREWWTAYESKAVSVPADAKDVPPGFSVYQNQETLEHFLVDPRVVNDALHELGCEARLQWKEVTGPRVRYELTRGRFRLGQQKGKLPKYVLDTSSPR